MNRYRHEYKYLIDRRQAAVLMQRAQALLARDAYAAENGFYEIHNLYFDDVKDSAYYDVEDGNDSRSKFRIRYYNDNAEALQLEKKSKLRGMTLKESCALSVEECGLLKQGRFPRITGDMPEKKKELLLQMQNGALRPRVIVSYRRYPFVYPAGNVRITFDTDIASSTDVRLFGAALYPRRPIMPQQGGILEIKWDEFLASFIKNELELESLQWTCFSKYYYCRRYSV